MKFAPHFFSSIALTAVLYPFFGWASLMAFVGGFIVDIDHYFYFVLRKRSLSPRGAWKYYYERKLMADRPMINIFHTAEAFVAVGVFALFSTPAMILAAGFLMHMILDFTETIYNDWWNDRSSSIIYWLVNHKKIRAQLSSS
ncbi:hypothetical protein ACFL3V_03905 [Nanoarchaeota archaeon]